LSGDIINGDPKGWDKDQCKIKLTVKLYWNIVTEFDWLNINLSVNIEKGPANDGCNNIEN